MSRPGIWITMLAVSTWAAGLAVAAPPIRLEPLANGFDRPVGVVEAADQSDRLFIFTLPGQIWIWDGEKVLEEPFLDLADGVRCCFGGGGVGGLAFHPDYADNGLFYVAYDGPNETSRLSRFRVSAGNPDRADRGSERVLLRVPQPFPRHHLGQLAFGPDGYLYVASGDGGSAGDVMNNGQSLDTLLGKILRLDVDGGPPYAVPPSNPFVDTAGAQPEIWAYGLRNPWRFSFDRRTGDLFIGDVGEDAWEEVNLQPAAAPGGRNYGWRLMEGTACFDPASDCNDGSITLPILQYPHVFGGVDRGCKSVTGGYRYRGPAAATLPRFYLFGDFCTGEIWGARPNAAGTWVATRLFDSDLSLVSFGEDRRGRLYAVDFGGAVYRIVGQGLLQSGFENGLKGFSGRRGNVTITSPGLRGSGHALQVGLDGRATVSTVTSTQPRGESTYRLVFDFDANGADPGSGVEILRLLDEIPHVRVVLEPGLLGRRLALLARTGPGIFQRAGALGIPKRGVVRVTIDWMRASAAGTADGQVALTIGDKRSIRARHLENRNRIVRRVTLGLPAGSTAAPGAGSLLFDNYSSTP